MQYLDNIVENFNSKLTTGLVGDKNCYGLVAAAKGEDQVEWVDKNENNVHFNSDKKYNFYHRINRVSSSLVVPTPGKKKLYNVTAQIDLIVFTSCRNFDEWIMKCISEISILTLLNIDYDAYKILKNETGASNYNFNNQYIFVVNYNALFQSDLCLARDVSSTFTC
jgi:hypothetical protein